MEYALSETSGRDVSVTSERLKLEKEGNQRSMLDNSENGDDVLLIILTYSISLRKFFGRKKTLFS